MNFVRTNGLRTLYISDLDGTLLRSNEVTSKYTNDIINELVEHGLLFSYATARSLITAKKVTKGINAKIPLIVYNGAFVIDNVSEEIMIANFFNQSVYLVLKDLFANGIYPIVYERDIYTNEQWLEIMPLETSKANAIKQLKKLLECDKIISFGDGKNDIDMFELSDECYAVQNANEELKKIATGTIGSNDEDGVAKWLEHNISL